MAYNPRFISGHHVPLPPVSAKHKAHVAALTSAKRKKRIDYPHHSVVMHSLRRQALYSACNIDGAHIPLKVPERADNWQQEANLSPDFQIDQDFYDTCGSIIDRGHLTKYEDPIWGSGLSAEEMKALGDSTFFFPNCSPQHRTLNRGMWKSLELYILDNQTDAADLKICMFTGPVLRDNDPVCKKKINDAEIQIPELFWKVIYYKSDSQLHAVGFLMSQQSLLKSTKLFKSVPAEKALLRVEPAFMNFKHSDPYQVKVEFLETICGLDFSCKGKCVYPYRKAKPEQLIYETIDIKPKSRGFIGKGFEANALAEKRFVFKNIKLS